MRILITGGAGFIGSHVVRHFVRTYPNYSIFNLDKLTYAGNLENLSDIENAPNYQFLKGDIVDGSQVATLFKEHCFDAVIHLAAESHVDRSILDPMAFVRTNIDGTLNLMNAAINHWKDPESHLFYHISTDEVFGSLGETGSFDENTPYAPNSPYAASKAGSDHFVRAYGRTYGLPYVISNCSNNYGPNQFPEKLVPLIINNILSRTSLPVYGTGHQVRDWLFVLDHVTAIDTIFHKGTKGSTYAIGGNNEWKNIELVNLLCDIMDAKLDRPDGSSRKLIEFVRDRPGHDERYAIESNKLQSELGWHPLTSFKTGLEQTVEWYLKNTDWLKNVVSGEYRHYYKKTYGGSIN